MAIFSLVARATIESNATKLSRRSRDAMVLRLLIRALKQTAKIKLPLRGTVSSIAANCFSIYDLASISWEITLWLIVLPLDQNADEARLAFSA